jgi:hypothetical protein
MSNELMPQEKHPKFYKDPHLWIGAIEVEYIGTKGIIGKSILDVDLLSTLILFGELLGVKPLFKPQEGEQFIKDLEQAVSAGFGGASVTHYKTPSSIVFEVDGGEIEIWSDLKITTSSGIAFDTSAYVITLLKLGYYL